MDRFEKWTWTKGTLDEHSILLERILGLLEEKKDAGINKNQQSFLIENDEGQITEEKF